MKKKNLFKGLLAPVLMLAVLLTACGEEETKNPPEASATGNTQSTTAESTTQPKTKAPEKSDLLHDTYKVPGKNIYVDVPNYQEVEKGYTELFIMHDQKYVAVTANKKGDASSLTAAHESAFEKFKRAIQDDSFVNSLNVTSDSTEAINGIEVYKYEGTLNCGHDTIYDAYTIGYSFIMDGVACNITGSVVDKEQPAEMIEEIKNVVEAMIQTLRSEK